MLDIRTRYNAKIILLGEYTAILTGQSLSIPYDRYYGKWDLSKNKSKNLQGLLQLSAAISKIGTIEFNNIRFEKDLENGSFFNSNIPQGYGCGSSGALIAAIYDKYCISKPDVLSIKEDLAQMENFFHGTSSGTDPLTILLNKPIFIEKGRVTKISEIKIPQFELIDSKKQRDTAGFVNDFIEKYNGNKAYKTNVDRLTKYNHVAMTSLIKGDRNLFKSSCLKISQLQFNLFGDMIVDSVRNLWERSLEEKSYCIKLNGAGGGGYYLKIIF